MMKRGGNSSDEAVLLSDAPGSVAEELQSSDLPVLQATRAGRNPGFPSILTSARDNAKRSAERLGKLVKGEGGIVDIDSKTILKYEFTCGGTCVELALAHADSVWYVKTDTAVIGTKTHNNTLLKSFSTSLDFSIPDSTAMNGSMQPLMARMTMEWVPRSVKWRYTLLVRDTVVPASWSKATGAVEDHVIPEICCNTVIAASL
jgi:hypothetical protein